MSAGEVTDALLSEPAHYLVEARMSDDPRVLEELDWTARYEAEVECPAVVGVVYGESEGIEFMLTLLLEDLGADGE